MTFTALNHRFGQLDTAALDAFMEKNDDPSKLAVNLTGVICTIGPACDNKETLREMLLAGMRIARLNFSHGSYESHGKIITMLKELRTEMKRDFAIALDTKGPEIRTGDIKSGAKTVPIVSGSEVVMSNDAAKFGDCASDFLYCDYPALGQLTVGASVFIEDGLLQLKVESIVDEHTIKCRALNASDLGSRKGVNLPNVDVALPAMTERDMADLAFGVTQGVDMVFASFIRSKAHVVEMREFLKAKGDEHNEILIVPKIENSEGLRNFKEILEVSDAIMAARGDMGIETLLETVPIKQKFMSQLCNEAGKPYIVATQMLESMCENPRATRAEVFDVAGAVLDGASMVMLSGEAAKGKYPREAVATQAKVARAVEKTLEHFAQCPGSRTMAVHPAEWLAKSAGARFIVAMECGSPDNKIPLLRHALPNTPVAYLGTNARRVQQANLGRAMLPRLVDAKLCNANDWAKTAAHLLSEGVACIKNYVPGAKVCAEEPIVLLASCPGHYCLSVTTLKAHGVEA